MSDTNLYTLVFKENNLTALPVLPARMATPQEKEELFTWEEVKSQLANYYLFKAQEIERLEEEEIGHRFILKGNFDEVTESGWYEIQSPKKSDENNKSDQPLQTKQGESKGN